MKKGFKRFFAIFLLLLVFATSTGLNIFTHLCSSSGYSEVSLQELEACCSSEATAADSDLKADCCTTEHLLLKSETPAVVTAHLILDIPVSISSLNLHLLQTIFPLQYTVQRLITTPPDDGYSGRQCLLQKDLLLI